MRLERLSAKLVSVAGLAGLVAGVVVLFQQSRQLSEEVRGLRAEVSRKEAASRAPRIILREVHTAGPQEPAAADQAPTVHAATDQKASPEQVTPLSVEEREHRDQLYFDAQVELYEDAYHSENPDPEWADDAAQKIRETYSAETFSALKLSVDCRGTLCRMDFEYSDPVAGLPAIRELTTVHPWLGYRETHYDLETKRGTSFFAREDYELPKLDATALKALGFAD